MERFSSFCYSTNSYEINKDLNKILSIKSDTRVLNLFRLLNLFLEYAHLMGYLQLEKILLS